MCLSLEWNQFLLPKGKKFLREEIFAELNFAEFIFAFLPLIRKNKFRKSQQKSLIRKNKFRKISWKSLIRKIKFHFFNLLFFRILEFYKLERDRGW